MYYYLLPHGHVFIEKKGWQLMFLEKKGVATKLHFAAF
jgi:hypothetical protein